MERNLKFDKTLASIKTESATLLCNLLVNNLIVSDFPQIRNSLPHSCVSKTTDANLICKSQRNLKRTSAMALLVWRKADMLFSKSSPPALRVVNSALRRRGPFLLGKPKNSLLFLSAHTNSIKRLRGITTPTTGSIANLSLGFVHLIPCSGCLNQKPSMVIRFGDLCIGCLNLFGPKRSCFSYPK